MTAKTKKAALLSSVAASGAAKKIELGIVAALSGDQAMMQAYLSGDPYLACGVDMRPAPGSKLLKQGSLS